MKKIIILSIGVSCFLASCQSLVKNENATEPDPFLSHQYRDQSITRENAFSDLFLDSSAVETFIERKNLNDTLAGQIRSFYNTRNFQFAWFTSQGINEEGRSFWYMSDFEKDNNEKPARDSISGLLDTLSMTDSIRLVETDSSIRDLELELTRHFVASRPLNDKKNLAAYPPVKKIGIMDLADSVLHKQDSAISGNNRSYSLLKQHLARYYDAAKKGGWQPVQLTKGTLKKNMTSPDITAIKKRLQLSGDFSNDTSNLFNDSLELAISSFQERHGLKPTGQINDSVINVMNVPAEERIGQMLINMNRMAWTPSFPDNYIMVNLPEFKLKTYEDGQKAFDMDVIIGKEGTHTLMFRGAINQIVFSPYWNIPAGIVKDELMPALKNDAAYLKKHNMEIVKASDSLPQIRQLPGKDNALGRVKFLFPNNFDIYFHDTPNKELFGRSDRALSHGCIRLADASKMAAYLLKDKKEWSQHKIKAAMESGKEQTVGLSKPVPVLISYYTAWVDENGRLQFRNDIYGKDKTTAGILFQINSSSGKELRQPQVKDSSIKKSV
jgi:murein L,D-transpeptidase YcbB/YkuD